MSSRLGLKVRDFVSNSNRLPQAVLAFGRTAILTSIVVTAALVGVRDLGMLEGMELGAYDQLVRSRPDEGADERLLVVGVSESDIQTRKEYPIHDGTLAQLLEKLEQYQPRAIGIDIIRDVPQGELGGRIALENMLKKSERAIAVCKLSSADDPGTPAAPGVPVDRVGAADWPVDPGGTLRRSLLLSVPGSYKLPLLNQHVCNIADTENQIPSLGLQLALVYLDAEGIQPELTPQGEMKIGSKIFKRLEEKAGGYRKADAGNYQVMLNYRSGNNAVKQVSMMEVLNGQIDPALVKDRVVLVGYTAALVKDDFFTPYSAGARDSQTMPGVVAHAQNVSQILSAVLSDRPLIWYWSEWRENLWIWGWSFVGALLAWRIRKLWLFALAIGVAVAALYATCYVVFLGAGWIPLIPSALALVVTAVGVVFAKYAKTIYQVVKKVILDIHIDEEKKQREVAAIADTDTFKELEKRAEDLRNNRRSDRNRNRRSRTAAIPSEPTESGDYYEQLQKRGKRLKKSEDTSSILQHSQAYLEKEEKVLTPSPQPSEPIQEKDYYEQLRQRGKKQKNPENASANLLLNSHASFGNFSPEATPIKTASYYEQLLNKAKQIRNAE